MKLRATTIAITLAGCAGVAFAGSPPTVMQPVIVSAGAVTACTPPNAAPGHVCDDFTQWIRANFSQREIGMLFGCESCYPEYLSGGINSLHRRYDGMLQEYVIARSWPAPTETSVAAQ